MYKRIGISEERKEIIFERYNSRQGEHYCLQTGLGLTLVKAIMERYKGIVTLESTVCVGSTFTLIFPSSMLSHQFSCEDVISNKKSVISHIYKSELTTNDKHESSSEEIPFENNAHTIMVIEDNDDMRMYITSILREKYKVIALSSATHALEKIKEVHIHLIVSDIMMEEMDGFAFLHALKQLPIEEHIPLIFLTARDFEEDKIRSLREGAIHYLTKPFSPEILLAIIESSIQHETSLIHSNMQKIKKEVDTILDKDSYISNKKRFSIEAESINRYMSECDFTRREQQVFNLIIEGKSDKEIAIVLDLSIKTVANHNQRIYHKANVNSRYELLSKVYALR